MRIVLLITVSLAGGCLFGSSSNEPGEDLGTAPLDLGVDDATTSGDAMSTADVDRPDATPTDTGSADVTSADVGTPDMSENPDMGPPAFEVVRTFDLALGGQPQLDSPAQVAMFQNGFVAGYVDDEGVARIAWYDENNATALDTAQYTQVTTDLDLVGGADVAFATFIQSNTEGRAIRLERNPASQTFDESVLMAPSPATAGAFGESRVGLIQDAAYIVSPRDLNINGTPDLTFGIADADSYGFVGTAYQELHLESIEVVRSDVGGLRILAAGASDPGGALYRYRLLHYEFVNPNWSVSTANCGVAPPNPHRVYPLGANAVLAIAPAGPDETELRRVECASGATSPTSQRINLGPGNVTDFDIAEELVTEGQTALAVGWVQDGSVHYAEIAITDSGVDVVRRWSLGAGIHVRVAYNFDANTAAVIVHGATGATLYLLKRT